MRKPLPLPVLFKHVRIHACAVRLAGTAALAGLLLPPRLPLLLKNLFVSLYISFEFQVSSFEFQVSSFEFQVSSFKFQVSRLLPQID